MRQNHKLCPFLWICFGYLNRFISVSPLCVYLPLIRVTSSTSCGIETMTKWKKNYNLQTSDDLVSLLFNRWLNRFELAAFACYTFHLNFFPLCSSFKYDFDKSKIAGSTHTLTTQPLVIDSEHFFGILLHKRN